MGLVDVGGCMLGIGMFFVGVWGDMTHVGTCTHAHAHTRTPVQAHARMHAHTHSGSHTHPHPVRYTHTYTHRNTFVCPFGRCLSVCLSVIYLLVPVQELVKGSNIGARGNVCLSACLSVCLSFCLSVCLSACLYYSVYVPILLSICRSVSLFDCLFTYASAAIKLLSRMRRVGRS